MGRSRRRRSLDVAPGGSLAGSQKVPRCEPDAVAMIEIPMTERRNGKMLERALFVRRMSVAPPVARTVLAREEVLALQQAADAVFVHDALVDYAVRLVLATRAPAEHGLPD